jgi:hypothetical protein
MLLSMKVINGVSSIDNIRNITYLNDVELRKWLVPWADIMVLEGQSIKKKRGILHAGASVYTMSDHQSIKNNWSSRW